MDGLYLYGIVGFPPALCRGIRGFGGNPVRLLPLADLGAVVSRSRQGPWPPDEAHLHLHEAVVEAVMDSRPILPARFNTLLGNEEAVIALLAQRARLFRSALLRVEGKVELGLRVLWEPPGEDNTCWESAGRGPGTDYLCRKLKTERRRARLLETGERLIHELQALLRPLASESRQERLPTERLLLAGAYLVARHQLRAFRDGVAEVQKRFPRLGFFLTGPWPPYHFVNGARDETADAHHN